MELKNSNLKRMSSNEILNAMMPSLTGLYCNLEYLNISKEDFYNIALAEITKTKDNYGNKSSYTEFIKNRVKYIVIEREKRSLTNNEEVLKLLNGYINYSFPDNGNLDSLLRSFKKLEKFLVLYNCELSPEITTSLLKNDKLNNMVKVMVDKCLPELTISKIMKLYNSYLLISIVEVYAMLNDIEIIDDEIEENDNYKSDEVDIYLKEISTKRVLTADEERELFIRYYNGDMDAKKELIECNLKLVVSFAKKYKNRGLDLADLIQEGNIGLLTAIDRFDINMGCKFSTYAYNWIRQSVTRAIMNKGRSVRLPVYWYYGLPSFFEKYNALANELNREPTLDEMVEKFNIPRNTVMRYHELMLETKSLNEFVGEDKDQEVGDFWLHTDNDVEDRVFDLELKDDVKRAFSVVGLSQKEIIVLELRFGFYEGKIFTLQAIADMFKVTRERIRQIELRALNKIRSNRLAMKLLAEYTSNPDENGKVLYKVYSSRKKME